MKLVRLSLVVALGLHFLSTGLVRAKLKKPAVNNAIIKVRANKGADADLLFKKTEGVVLESQDADTELKVLCERGNVLEELVVEGEEPRRFTFSSLEPGNSFTVALGELISNLTINKVKTSSKNGVTIHSIKWTEENKLAKGTIKLACNDPGEEPLIGIQGFEFIRSFTVFPGSHTLQIIGRQSDGRTMRFVTKQGDASNLTVKISRDSCLGSKTGFNSISGNPADLNVSSRTTFFCLKNKGSTTVSGDVFQG